MVMQQLKNTGDKIKNFFMNNLEDLIHLLIVGPLLILLSRKSKNAVLSFTSFVLGVVIIAYYGYKMVMKLIH